MHPVLFFPRWPSARRFQQAGLLTPGSSYFPSLPTSFLEAVVTSGIVPGYSGGTAPDSHRLPY